MESFTELTLEPSIRDALKKMGYEKPSPIQAQAIPLIQEGHDVIALAKTGSGKTAACAIPVCDRVDVSRTDIQALIVVPTRELALQYATETQKIGKLRGVKAYAMFGGEDYSLQRAKLSHGVQVLIATPGRLIDFIYKREVDLSEVATLILDEADEMLSMGFYDDIDFIIQCLIHEHQTLLFSATMPQQIRKIAQHHMKTPREVVFEQKERIPDTISHRFGFCQHHDRDEVLLGMLKKHSPKQAIVFCKSRVQVEQLSRSLGRNLREVDYLHGGLSQEARRSITGKFRSGRIRFLVATDVAARGLDFSGVTHVFMYQLPEDPETYIHRAGRTGRMERSGEVLSLVTSREIGALKRILELMKKEAIWEGDPPRNWDSIKDSKAPPKPPRGRGGPKGSSRPRRRPPSKPKS